VDVVLANSGLSNAVHLRRVFALDNGIFAAERGANFFLRETVILLEEDKLIRNDAHLHERDCLNFSSGETLNDVGLLLFFHELNLVFDQFNDDFIFNETAGLA